MKFYLVVAMDAKRGIGKDGKLPWHISGDLRYFSKLTQKTDDPNKQNAVIMGRKSWESIPEKYQPLPNRYNIVLTRNDDYSVPEGVGLAHSMEGALKVAEEAGVENVYVIGGGKVFEEVLGDPNCAGIYLTEILETFDCDTFFPEIDESRFKREAESEVHEEVKIHFQFVKYLAA